MLDSIEVTLLPEIVERNPRRLSLSTPPIARLCTHAKRLIDFSPENEFQTFLYFEKRRVQRSGGCFALLLLEVSPPFQKSEINSLIATLQNSMRETDIAGWYKTGAVIGVVFTEVARTNSAAISEVLLNKMIGALSLLLSKEVMSDIRAEVTAFPENLQDERPAVLQSGVG